MKEKENASAQENLGERAETQWPPLPLSFPSSPGLSRPSLHIPMGCWMCPNPPPRAPKPQEGWNQAASCCAILPNYDLHNMTGAQLGPEAEVLWRWGELSLQVNKRRASWLELQGMPDGRGIALQPQVPSWIGHVDRHWSGVQ